MRVCASNIFVLFWLGFVPATFADREHSGEHKPLPPKPIAPIRAPSIPPGGRATSVTFYDFSKTPWALTPRDACGLFSTVLAYTQFRSSTSGMCSLDDTKQTCLRIRDVMSGVITGSTEAEKKSLAEKVPLILDKVYKCLATINDDSFKDLFRSRELLLEKKKVLLENACQTIAELSKSSNDSPDGTPERLVNYDNPCRAMREFNAGRIDSCFSTGGDLCKIAIGKVELENLVPTSIYDASFSEEVIPAKMNAYVAGALDGAIHVTRDRTIDKLNDLVTKKVVARAGYAGTVALATITAAAKQINEAATTGNNAWANCVGSDQLGACLYNLFKGGLPESHPIDLPQRRGDHFERRCCRCTLDMYEDDAILMSDTKISSQPYFGPIEGGDFDKSFCKAWEGTRQDKALLFSKAGNPVYFIPRDCRPVIVRGSVCQPPPPANSDRKLEVVEDPLSKPGVVSFPTVNSAKRASSTLSAGPAVIDSTYDSIFEETPSTSKQTPYPYENFPRVPDGRSGTSRANPAFPSENAAGLSRANRPPSPDRASTLRSPFQENGAEPAKRGNEGAKAPTTQVSTVDACTCGLEMSVPTLSNIGSYFRYYLCVMRLNGREVTRTLASAFDPSCTQQCANFRKWDPASQECRISNPSAVPPENKSSSETPSQNSGSADKSGRLPSLLASPGTASTQNFRSCTCQSEWSRLTQGLHWKLCVVRQNGREVAWGYDYYNDCTGFCSSATNLPSVSLRCQ